MKIINYVSIVLPAYEEDENLKILVPKLINHCSELIIVIKKPSNQILNFLSNYTKKILIQNDSGKGNAIKLGLTSVTKPVTVLFDADLSHDVDDIPYLIYKIFKNEADHVHGSRTLGGSDELAGNFDRFLRSTGSHVILQVINFYFKQELTESQNGFRALRSDLIKKIHIQEKKTCFEQEIIIKSLKCGIRVKEISTHEYARVYGKSKISLLKNSVNYVFSLFKYLILNYKIDDLNLINEKWNEYLKSIEDDIANDLQNIYKKNKFKLYKFNKYI
jgi:hypothetical protein